MQKQPIDFLFSPYRREMLATLSLHRELKAMAESGLLLREKVGNQVFYRPDASCPIHDELAAIFRKTTGLTSLLRDALQKLSDRIEFAFVFGSMADGRQTAGSDLDLCVLGDVSLLDVVKALSPAQKTLRREMNPVVMPVKKFRHQVAKKDRFAVRVMSEPRLFVMGDEDELAELVENRATRNA